MNTPYKYSIFVLFVLAIGIGSSEVFASSEVYIKTVTGSGVPGCEETLKGCFIPSTAIVELGQTVIFTNTDTAAHTFTSGDITDDGVGRDGLFDSSLMLKGSSFEWTPTQVGEYEYFCMVHPWMQGLIIVEGASEENNVDEVEALAYHIDRYATESSLLKVYLLNGKVYDYDWEGPYGSYGGDDGFRDYRYYLDDKYYFNGMNIESANPTDIINYHITNTDGTAPTDEVITLRAENANLRSEVDRLYVLEKDFENMEEAKDSIGNELDRCVSELQVYKNSVAACEGSFEEIRNNRQDVIDALKLEHSIELEKLQQQVYNSTGYTDLQSEISELKSENTELKSENNELRDDLSRELASHTATQSLLTELVQAFNRQFNIQYNITTIN
ncbi:MAG: hypothetical protein LVO36_04800 [Nitrosopumilus sp. (ex Thoosa mismalolli)]|nr:hypothetical protein [Nitrosopumilus sp. (ex Thoosa mismalolli)]